MVFEFAVAADHPLTELAMPLLPNAIQDYSTVIMADSSRHLSQRSSGLLDGRSRIIIQTIEPKIEAQCKLERSPIFAGFGLSARIQLLYCAREGWPWSYLQERDGR